MPMNSKSRDLMSRLNPEETVIDGGPARCRALDRRSFEVLEEMLGGTGAVRRFAQSQGAGAGSFMEADWVATDRGLYYVNFNAGMHHGWPWADIAKIDVIGSAALGTMKRLSIKLASAEFELSVSKRAARDLLGLAGERMGG